MFKFSLLLFFVSSALFCQANPTALNQPSSDTPLTPDKQSNSTSSAPVATSENDGSKGGSKTLPKLDSHKSTVSDLSNSTTTTPSNTTTTSTTTTTTSAPPTHPPTQPPTQPPTHPPTQPPTHPPTQPPTHPPTQPPTHSPTTVPPPPTVPPKPSSDGGFNLISFLGGMILGLGLLAIGYVIFKFYQTRRDSSYRTL